MLSRAECLRQTTPRFGDAAVQRRGATAKPPAAVVAAARARRRRSRRWLRRRIQRAQGAERVSRISLEVICAATECLRNTRSSGRRHYDWRRWCVRRQRRLEVLAGLFGRRGSSLQLRGSELPDGAARAFLAATERAACPPRPRPRAGPSLRRRSGGRVAPLRRAAAEAAFSALAEARRRARGRARGRAGARVGEGPARRVRKRRRRPRRRRGRHLAHARTAAERRSERMPAERTAAPPAARRSAGGEVQPGGARAASRRGVARPAGALRRGRRR